MNESVPAGWERKSLSTLADYINGRAFKPHEWSRNGVPIIRIAQINNSKSDMDFYEGNDLEEKHQIINGDLIFSWSATLTALIWDRGLGALNQHIFKVCEKENISRHYLHQLILYSIPFLAEYSHGSTMKHIKKGVLDEFEVPLPPLPEQQKIASILTSVDTVIEKTEAQINKLKDLKQAMMQELLTKGIGHTEFKDSPVGRIPKGWKVKRVDSFLNQSKKKGRTELPIYSVLMEGGMVKRSTVERRVPSELDESENLYVKKGCLVYNMMRMWQGASGIAPVDCLVSPAYVVCEPLESIDSDFLGYLMKLDSTIRKLHSHSQGITGDRLRLYFEHFSVIVFAIPPLSEQQKIVSILSSLDINIKEKQRKLQHTKSLKKALMQDLLTGKIRVKV